MDLSYRIMGLAARLLLALGVVCLLLGAYLLSESMSFGGDTLRATGSVVSQREVRDGDEVRYRPRVRFTTPDGDIITFEGQLATTRQRFAVGEQVPVVYPRTDPQKARVALFADNWLGPVAALVVGLLALVAGILVRRNVTNALKRGA